jgi:hypothetical protein
VEIIDREKDQILKEKYGLKEDNNIERRMMHDDCTRTGLRLEELIGEKRVLDTKSYWTGKEDVYSIELVLIQKRLVKYG